MVHDCLSRSFFYFNRYSSLEFSSMYVVTIITCHFAARSALTLSPRFHKILKFALKKFNDLKFRKDINKDMCHLGLLFLTNLLDLPWRVI